MKLTLFLSTATAVTLTSAAVIETRQINCPGNPQWLGHLGGYDLSCENLAINCIYDASNGTDNLWSHPTCVAAATCAGTQNIYAAANCTNPAIPPNPADVPSLDYNLYASIVGSCAWDEGGCPITFQNYVDFFYGQLTAIGSDSYPSSVEFVQTYFWDPLVSWTATGDTVPYSNFNDWLHYSEYVPEYVVYGSK